MVIYVKLEVSTNVQEYLRIDSLELKRS